MGPEDANAEATGQQCHRSSFLSQRFLDSLVARTLLGAPGIATSNKKLLGAPGLTTRSKDAIRKSGHIPKHPNLPVVARCFTESGPLDTAPSARRAPGRAGCAQCQSLALPSLQWRACTYTGSMVPKRRPSQVWRGSRIVCRYALITEGIDVDES